MARNTKAKAVKVTFVEAFAASQAEIKAKETMITWARSLNGAKRRNENKAAFTKRAFMAAGDQIREAGEDYFWMLDQKMLEAEKPEYKLATKPGGKPHSLCSAIYDAVNEKFPKAPKPPKMVDKDVIKAFTEVLTANGITTKEGAVAFCKALAAKS